MGCKSGFEGHCLGEVPCHKKSMKRRDAMHDLCSGQERVTMLTSNYLEKDNRCWM